MVISCAPRQGALVNTVHTSAPANNLRLTDGDRRVFTGLSDTSAWKLAESLSEFINRKGKSRFKLRYAHVKNMVLPKMRQTCMVESLGSLTLRSQGAVRVLRSEQVQGRRLDPSVSDNVWADLVQRSYQSVAYEDLVASCGALSMLDERCRQPQTVTRCSTYLQCANVSWSA